MQKLIYKLAMYRSRKYFIDRYSMEWYKGFKEESDKRFREIMPQIPDIGNSIFSTNYIFAPSYIAWYLALKEKNISPTETDEIIWHMNENLIKSVPEFFM